MKALVLGAGGAAASSFEVGLIAGLADEGVDVSGADLMVGTSAGARVAIQLAEYASPAALYTAQLATEPMALPNVDWRAWMDAIQRAKKNPDRKAALREMAAFKPAHPDNTERLAFIARQLPARDWPDRDIRLVAVEAETGERRELDRMSGPDLIDAVAASGALAGAYAPIEIGGKHYIDGGFYSTDNADVATGYDRVLILTLRPGKPPMTLVPLDDAIDILAKNGGQSYVVRPDSASQAIYDAAHGNALDPAVHAPALETSREHGRRIAQEIGAFWNGT
jgi:NTE family protein